MMLRKILVDISGNLEQNISQPSTTMKFFLFIIFSAVALTLFGIVSYSEKCAEDAKRYREQRKIELISKNDNSDFWPSRNYENMIVTHPKPKPTPPIVCKAVPIPVPVPEATPEKEVVYRKRVVTSRDYRYDYVYNKKWVNGREVDINYQTDEEKELSKRYFGL